MRSAKGAARPEGGGARARRRLAAYFVFSGMCLIWPIHGWLGNSVEPRVLGLPWSFAYVLAIVLANFGVLALAYRFRWVDDELTSTPEEHG